MGFSLGNLFKNPLGTIADTVSAPFKSVGKIVTGKGNLGDFLNTGMTALGLGNIGKLNLGSFAQKIGLPNFNKMQTKDFLPYIGGAAAIADQATQRKPQYQNNTGAAQRIFESYAPLAEMDAQAKIEDFPRVLDARRKAADLLDPANDSVLARLVGSENMASARSAGRTGSNYLARQGYSSGVAQGAMLDALNRAQTASNDFVAYLNSPRTKAERQAGVAQILNSPTLGNEILQMLAVAQNLSNTQRQMDEQYRQPTALENILGVLPGLLPYLGQESGDAAPERFYENPIGPMPDEYIDYGHGRQF